MGAGAGAGVGAGAGEDTYDGCWALSGARQPSAHPADPWCVGGFPGGHWQSLVCAVCELGGCRAVSCCKPHPATQLPLWTWTGATATRSPPAPPTSSSTCARWAGVAVRGATGAAGSESLEPPSPLTAHVEVAGVDGCKQRSRQMNGPQKAATLESCPCGTPHVLR